MSGIVFVVAKEDPFAKLTYPISELGGCTDKNACEVYCSKTENMKACLNFASIHNLLPEEEIDMGQRMLALGVAKGPGGCGGTEACEAYCDQIEHIKECIVFAEKNNLIPPDELKEARKVIQAIDRGLVPPKCKGKKECDIYCSKSEHMEECITFAKEAGLMPPEELRDAEKVLEAIKKGAKPPACAGKKECDVYCSQSEHMEECVEFGIAAGFMPPEEVENAKRTLKAIKQGVRPPNCQGKEECDVYCSQSEHMEECMEFGIAAGFIPPEEIEGARGALKAIKQGVMPPKCQGKEECDVYCSQREHMGECMEFGIAAGFMPPEAIENAQRTLKAIKKGVFPPDCQGEGACKIYCSQPEHMEECLNFSEAAGFMSPEEVERARTGGGAGPGGCKTKEECEAFCSKPENAETCAEQMRQGSTGQMPGGIPAGPGGCTNTEECQKYCESNPETCKNFQPPVPPMQGGSPMPCQGENCPPPPSMPSGESGPAIMPSCESGNCPPPPPPSTAPDGGESLPPGEYVPPAPPSGEPTPPPPPPPTSFLNSFLGLIIYPFKLLLR